MSDTTTIRVTRDTRNELRDLAARRNETLAEAVARAARLLRQEEIGRDLSVPLTEDEVTWLDADAG